jgi:hypothetical protein
LPQKFDAAGFSAPHLAQSLASAFPHCVQKLLPNGLFVSHFEQRIGYLNKQALPSYITRRRKGTTLLRKDDCNISTRHLQQKLPRAMIDAALEGAR